MKTSTKIIAWGSAVALGLTIALSPVMNCYDEPPKSDTNTSTGANHEFQLKKEKLEILIQELQSNPNFTNKDSKIYLDYKDAMQKYGNLADSFYFKTKGLSEE